MPLLQVEVASVELIDEVQAVVRLRPCGSPSETRSWLPIWMGPHEGALISIASAGQRSSRPLTHDVLQLLLAHFELHLERAVITEMRGDIFHAQIDVESKRKRTSIDCRPADAIALALRERAPIYLSEGLAEQVSGSDGPESLFANGSSRTTPDGDDGVHTGEQR